MDAAANDPELAQEMIKLLGNELKVVRQQLREYKNKEDRASSALSLAESTELKDENAKLKDQLDDMRLRLEAALENEDDKSNLLQSPPYDEIHARLAEVLEERDRREQQHAEEIEGLESKVQTYREKYQKVKESRESVRRSLSELQDEYSAAMADRDSALAQVPKSEPFFDAFKFLAMPRAETSQPAAMTHFSTAVKFAIPDEARTICSSDGIITATFNEVVWPEDGVAHCLMFIPMYRFNARAKAGSGTWEKFIEALPQCPGQQRELFYMSNRIWFYYGLFEHVGTTTMSMDDVRKLGSQRVIDHIVKKTIQFRDLVPPLIAKMVQNMYDTGVLKIHCHGLRCVGFNDKLSKALFPSPSSGGRPGHAVSVPEEGSTGDSTKKRARDGERDGRSSKKTKSSV